MDRQKQYKFQVLTFDLELFLGFPKKTFFQVFFCFAYFIVISKGGKTLILFSVQKYKLFGYFLT